VFFHIGEVQFLDFCDFSSQFLDSLADILHAVRLYCARLLSDSLNTPRVRCRIGCRKVYLADLLKTEFPDLSNHKLPPAGEKAFLTIGKIVGDGGRATTGIAAERNVDQISPRVNRALEASAETRNETMLAI
jgi:hypothetical protein